MNPFKLFLAALWVLGARRWALLQALARPPGPRRLCAVERLGARGRPGRLPGAMLLALALHVLVSVNVLRLVLLGSQAVPPLGYPPGADANGARALGLQALAMTFAMLAFAPWPPRVPGLAICAAAGIFAAGRASLLLPEAALDRPLTGGNCGIGGRARVLPCGDRARSSGAPGAALALGADGGWALSVSNAAGPGAGLDHSYLALAAGTLERTAPEGSAPEGSAPPAPAEVPPPSKSRRMPRREYCALRPRRLGDPGPGAGGGGDPTAAHGRLKASCCALRARAGPALLNRALRPWIRCCLTWGSCEFTKPICAGWPCSGMAVG